MNYYKPGTWNAVCDVCGLEFKSDELKKRWDGLMVCSPDWEPRHSLDFLRTVPDNSTLPWSRPEPADIFIELPDAIDTSIPFYAIAEDAVADASLTAPNPLL